MLCSRFWIGMCEKNGKIINNLPQGVKVPIEVSRGLFEYNCKELTNLASLTQVVYLLIYTSRIADFPKNLNKK